MKFEQIQIFVIAECVMKRVGTPSKHSGHENVLAWQNMNLHEATRALKLLIKCADTVTIAVHKEFESL